jgi:hypothetical protein
MADQPAGYERPFDHWNYRVLKRTAMTVHGEDQSFELIEAYYDKYGRIAAWCPATPGGNDLKELESDLRQMALVAGMANLKSEGKRFLTTADLPVEAEHSDGGES